MVVKKRIMIVGASGYGNLGDDAYKIIFNKYLSNEYDLIFDSPYPDLRYIEKIDHLIIGGGGLIYENNTEHFNYMSMYINKARELGIPYYFISCGLQIPVTKEELEKKDYTSLSKHIDGWKDHLINSKLITVRSSTDKEVINALLNNYGVNKYDRLFYCPDLCYLLEPSNYQVADNIGTVIIFGEKSLNNYDFLSAIKNELNKQDTYFLSLSSINHSIINEYISMLRHESNYNDRKMITPQEAIRMIKDSNNVITDRYHGIVFARVANKNENDIRNLMNNYKGMTEEIPINKMAAIANIEILKRVLKEK